MVGLLGGGQLRATTLVEEGTQPGATVFGKKCTPRRDPRHFLLTVAISMQGKNTNCGISLIKKPMDFLDQKSKNVRVPSACLLSSLLWVSSLQAAPPITPGWIHPRLMMMSILFPCAL